jgi:hypothetical protein
MSRNRPQFNYEVFQLPGLPPLPRSATHEERRRYRRDLLIYLAYRQGLTQQFIADAFDLSVNLVRSVVRRQATYSDTPKEQPQSRARTWMPAEPVLPPTANPKSRGRARRDLMIRLFHHHGFSQRVLASVFELPRSRIADIVAAEDDDEGLLREPSTSAQDSVHS